MPRRSVRVHVRRLQQQQPLEEEEDEGRAESVRSFPKERERDDDVNRINGNDNDIGCSNDWRERDGGGG